MAFYTEGVVELSPGLPETSASELEATLGTLRRRDARTHNIASIRGVQMRRPRAMLAAGDAG